MMYRSLPLIPQQHPLLDRKHPVAQTSKFGTRTSFAPMSFEAERPRRQGRAGGRRRKPLPATSTRTSTGSCGATLRCLARSRVRKTTTTRRTTTTTRKRGGRVVPRGTTLCLWSHLHCWRYKQCSTDIKATAHPATAQRTAQTAPWVPTRHHLDALSSVGLLPVYLPGVPDSTVHNPIEHVYACVHILGSPCTVGFRSHKKPCVFP